MTVHGAITAGEPLLPDRQTFDRLHLTIAPGDHYGLEFPISVPMLEDFGPAFLTRAFRASGAIAADNEVTAIVALQPISVQGASERALLTVDYARDEPGLHKQLFVKFPPLEPNFKFGLIRMGYGEVAMQRLSGSDGFPVKTAKYYFGDHCAKTTNFILITERIPFGVAPVSPALRKGYDHMIAGVEGHYELLVRALARLVGAHKRGAMPPEVDGIFPYAGAARDFEPIDDAAGKIDRLIEFISQTAPHLFIAEASDPAFMARWREDLLYGLEHKDVVIAYLHGDADYTGICHPNLNVDNAWYWREPSGDLQIGLLDWGGAGHMSVAQALSGMLMMPEPEKYQRLVDFVLSTFREELAAQCGVTLDAEELRLQFKASTFSTAICTIVEFFGDVFAVHTPEAYASMKDRFDPRLLDSGLIAAIIWVDNILREWTDDLTPGDACREIVARSASHAKAMVAANG
jgi:hypothetical protein